MAQVRIPPGPAGDSRTYPHCAQVGSRYHCGHFFALHRNRKTMRNSAVLLIACPDKKGLVAAIANFLSGT
jgi:hypothetical protein